MKIDVMGLKFDSMTMDEALSRAEALLRGEKAAYVVTPNAEIAYEAETSFAETTLLGDTSTTPASPSAGAST